MNALLLYSISTAIPLLVISGWIYIYTKNKRKKLNETVHSSLIENIQDNAENSNNSHEKQEAIEDNIERLVNHIFLTFYHFKYFREVIYDENFCRLSKIFDLFENIKRNELENQPISKNFLYKIEYTRSLSPSQLAKYQFSDMKDTFSYYRYALNYISQDLKKSGFFANTNYDKEFEKLMYGRENKVSKTPVRNPEMLTRIFNDEEVKNLIGLKKDDFYICKEKFISEVINKKDSYIQKYIEETKLKLNYEDFFNENIYFSICIFCDKDINGNAYNFKMLEDVTEIFIGGFYELKVFHVYSVIDEGVDYLKNSFYIRDGVWRSFDDIKEYKNDEIIKILSKKNKHIYLFYEKNIEKRL